MWKSAHDLRFVADLNDKLSAEEPSVLTCNLGGCVDGWAPARRGFNSGFEPDPDPQAATSQTPSQMSSEFVWESDIFTCPPTVRIAALSCVLWVEQAMQ